MVDNYCPASSVIDKNHTIHLPINNRSNWIRDIIRVDHSVHAHARYDITLYERLFIFFSTKMQQKIVEL